jgi:hypothetical protein
MKRIASLFMSGILTFTLAWKMKGQCYKDLPLEELSQAEISSLQWMREEEMLAHDVYARLAEEYTVPVFQNIAKSEMQHTTSIAGLLERYGVEDPAADHVPGKFSSPEIQSLYDQLVKQGTSSWEEAVKVGLQIEDMDIADLDKAIAEQVDNQDILMVYNNLLRGSANHMNAFWRHASRNAIDWEPEHISREKLDGILGYEGK